jgi:microcystin-dependent protein
LTTSNKNFRVKNGLEVLGVSATVDGNEVLTVASSLDALANVDTTGVVDGNTIVFNEATSTFIAGAISGGAAFEISDTAPENANHGDVWYNSNNGGLFIYFEDLDSEQWVQVGLAGPKGDIGPIGETGEPGVAIQETEPEDTNVLWFDTSVDGAGIPLGGTSGQVLSKIDATDFNTEWVTPYTQADANSDISTAISNVVDTAPEVLDTLNELSAALNDDPNFSTTVANALAALVPAGTVIQSARVSAPAGYLLCEGQAVSRSTYSALFDAIGTTYGVGDGSSTFNIPNLQGKVPVGKNSGTFSTLGATGGAETHTLDATQIPSHNHTFSATTNTTGNHNHSIGFSDSTIPGWSFISNNGAYDPVPFTSQYGGWGTNYSGNHSHTVSGTTSSVGDGQAHNNLQPYIVLNYMIKI